MTKDRCKVLDGDAIERLREIFNKVCTDCGTELVEVDGEDDHVHLLVNYPRKNKSDAYRHGHPGSPPFPGG